MSSFGKTQLMKYWLLFVPFLLMGTTVETANDGKSLYMQNCVSCHGVDARGDGPAWPRV